MSRFAGVVLLPVWIVALCGAQQSLRVDVRLINIFATVTDSSGRYVAGLKKDDFVLEEDGIPQEISHFDQDENIPVSVGIIFDTSGSMQDKLRTAVIAVDQFVRTIHEDDDIFLMTFSGRTGLRQDFTSDRDKLSKALRNIQATGSTALYDALKEGLIKIRSGKHQKRAILLITDGQDTSSSTVFPEIVQRVRESELLVYALGISATTYSDPSEHVPFNWPPILPGTVQRPMRGRRDAVDMNVLETLGSESGGRAFLLSDILIGAGNNIERVLSEVAAELRSQYSLGFYPKHPDDGRYHTLRVTTQSGLPVRGRRGYTAG
jgi:Ca-activated chloride channel family protein